MHLNIGPLEINTRGLPRVFSMRVSPSPAGDRVNVNILLQSEQRAAVAKWAQRLGTQVVDGAPYQSRPGERWTQPFETVREVEGYRVRVWTCIDLDESTRPEDVPAAAPALAAESPPGDGA